MIIAESCIQGWPSLLFHVSHFILSMLNGFAFLTRLTHPLVYLLMSWRAPPHCRCRTTQMAWRESYSKNIHSCHVCPTTTHKVRICLLAWGSFKKLISTQWKQSSYFNEIYLKRRTYLGIWAHKKMKMIKSFRCFHFCTWTRRQLRSATWLKNNLSDLCVTQKDYIFADIKHSLTLLTTSLFIYVLCNGHLFLLLFLTYSNYPTKSWFTK